LVVKCKQGIMAASVFGCDSVCACERTRVYKQKYMYPYLTIFITGIDIGAPKGVGLTYTTFSFHNLGRYVAAALIRHSS
jgi:hypothetical protein